MPSSALLHPTLKPCDCKKKYLFTFLIVGKALWTARDLLRVIVQVAKLAIFADEELLLFNVNFFTSSGIMLYEPKAY